MTPLRGRSTTPGRIAGAVIAPGFVVLTALICTSIARALIAGRSLSSALPAAGDWSGAVFWIFIVAMPLSVIALAVWLVLHEVRWNGPLIAMAFGVAASWGSWLALFGLLGSAPAAPRPAGAAFLVCVGLVCGLANWAILYLGRPLRPRPASEGAPSP